MIRNERDYDIAVTELDALWGKVDVGLSDEESDRFNELGTLIEDYEDSSFPNKKIDNL